MLHDSVAVHSSITVHGSVTAHGSLFSNCSRLKVASNYAWNLHSATSALFCAFAVRDAHSLLHRLNFACALRHNCTIAATSLSAAFWAGIPMSTPLVEVALSLGSASARGLSKVFCIRCLISRSCATSTYCKYKGNGCITAARNSFETVACPVSARSRLHDEQVLQTAGSLICANNPAKSDAVPSLDLVRPDVLRCRNLQIVCARPQ